MKRKMIAYMLLLLPFLMGANCKKNSLNSDCYKGKVISLKASEVGTDLLDSWGLIQIEQTIPNGISHHSIIAFDIASINTVLKKEQLLYFKIGKLTSIRTITGIFPSNSYQYLADIQLCNK